MACVLYRNGESIRVNYKSVQNHIAQGWSTSRDPAKVEAKEPEPEKELSFEDVDTNNSGKLSSEEVRAAAKEAGIEGWEKKRIKTLKGELGL